MRNFVYIISDGTYLKIGVTSRLDKRLKQLQIGHSMPLSVVHTSEPMSRSNAFFVEKYAHLQLVAHRLHGEWFDVPLTKAIEAVESINFETTTTQAKSVPVSSEPFRSISDAIIASL